MKYKIQRVSKINLLKKESYRDDYGLKKHKNFIQYIKLFDKKILINDSRCLKIYNYPFFHLIAQIYSGCFSATLLKSKNIACCQHYGTISIYSIKDDKFKLIQIIDVIKERTVYRVKELMNGMLVSCQDERALTFYEYDKNKKLYNIKQKIKFKDFIDNLLYTKDNDILLYQKDAYGSNYKLILYDFKKDEKKEIASDSGSGLIYEPFKFLNKNIVAVIISKCIFLIDINKDYNIITKLLTSSSWLNCICIINDKCIITGDDYGNIILFELKNNQLYEKEKYKYYIKKNYSSISSSITDLLYLGNNLFFVGGIYYDNYSSILRKFSRSIKSPFIPYNGYISDLFEVI